jgi:HAD superfamily hydrolase (TIGR01549 family)
MQNPTSPRPRAVIFDLGNTLALPDWPRITSVSGRVVRLAAGEDELQSRLCQVMAEADRSQDFLRDVADRRLAPGWELRRLYSGLGVDGPRLDELMAALTAEHDKKHLWCALNEEAVPVLGELRSRGIKLGVISNSPDGRVEELIDLLGIGDYFGSVTDSYRAGVAKPDPRIFSHSVGQLGLGAGDAVYVGDSYAQDVAGAQDAGLRGVLYDPQDLRPDLDVARIRSLKELKGIWR